MGFLEGKSVMLIVFCKVLKKSIYLIKKIEIYISYIFHLPRKCLEDSSQSGTFLDIANIFKDLGYQVYFTKDKSNLN